MYLQGINVQESDHHHSPMIRLLGQDKEPTIHWSLSILCHVGCVCTRSKHFFLPPAPHKQALATTGQDPAQS